MARSQSESIPDMVAVEKPLPIACSESSRAVKSERQHRNGVPISRSRRSHLALPVFVYGYSSSKEPLLEAARTLVVYAHGALVALDAALEPGQELVLVNPKTKVEAACHVAALELKKNGCKSMVELEFIHPAPRFWGVVFPPENWDPAERKLPRAPRGSCRVKCFQPVRVRPAEESANHFEDVCSTQNISRDSLYFTNGHLGYRKGMRVVITFLHHSDFFAPNTNYTGRIVRVDQSEDGRVGVAVKLFGRINAEPPATPISPRRE